MFKSTTYALFSVMCFYPLQKGFGLVYKIMRPNIYPYEYHVQPRITHGTHYVIAFLTTVLNTRGRPMIVSFSEVGDYPLGLEPVLIVTPTAVFGLLRKTPCSLLVIWIA